MYLRAHSILAHISLYFPFFTEVAGFAIAWVYFHVLNQIPTRWTLRLFVAFYLKKILLWS